MPFLFQRRYGSEDRPINRSYIRECMVTTSRAAQITIAGQPLEWRPHDFRRIFVTDALRSGLPPHIAAKICGHALLDTTMGYAAIYPEDVVSHHRAFIARRRAGRPSEDTVTSPPENGTNSSPISSSGRSPSESAAATTAPHVRTKTLASDAPSFELTQLRRHDWKRSTPTSATGSRKPRNKAGPARSPQSRPPWPPPRRSWRPCASSPPAAPPSTSACPTSAAPPDDQVPRKADRSLPSARPAIACSRQYRRRRHPRERAQQRTPPGDPWNITLTYQHGHRWWFDADTAPETWHVSADIHDDSGTHVEAHVGDMTIVIVDIYDTHDPFGLLDGEEADLGLIAGVIFNAGNGRLAPDLDEQLQPLGSRILILNSVRLTPEWRGFGLGVLLTGTAIKETVRRRPGRSLLPGPDRRTHQPRTGRLRTPASHSRPRPGLGQARVRAPS